MKEIPSKSTGDFLTATEFNEGINSELQNTVSQTDQAFSIIDLTQTGQAISRVSSTIIRYSDSGAVNAYQLTLAQAYFPVDSYINGLTGYFLALNENTGASTININGLGNKSAVDYLGNPLTGGEISAVAVNFFTYDLANDYVIIYQVNATDAALAALLGQNADSATAGANNVGLYLDASSTSTNAETYLNQFVLAAGRFKYIGIAPTGNATAADFTLDAEVNINPVFAVSSVAARTTVTVDFLTALSTLNPTNLRIILASGEDAQGQSISSNITTTNSDANTASFYLTESGGNRFNCDFSFMILGFPS